MEEPSERTPMQKFLISVAWCVLVFTAPFALSTMFVSCQDFGSAHISEVFAQRMPWFSAGFFASIASLVAAYFLAKHSDWERNKTPIGCGMGCLGLILFALVWIIIGYSNSR